MTDYNGWANQETWTVANWIQAHPDAADWWRTRAEVLDVATLAKNLGDQVDIVAPRMEGQVYGDLLRCALAKVDWREIATALKE